MLERLSEKFAEKLIHAEIISETDADVYVYGFFQSVMLLLNITTTILLGILFQEFFLCLMLNAAYIPIRISAGGHHANSPFRCYVNSTVIIAALLAVIKWIPINTIIVLVLLGFSGVVIWMLAPVDTKNHPFNEIEQKIYRKRAKIVWIVEAAVCIVLLVFVKEQYAAAIVLGLFTEAAMLLIGARKNHHTEDYNN